MDDRLIPRRKDKYLAMLPAPCQVCGLNCDVHNKTVEADRLSRYACEKVDWAGDGAEEVLQLIRET